MAEYKAGALREAAEGGDAAAVRALLAGGADPNSAAERDPDFHATPLHLACIEGHLEPAQALLQAGADLTATTADGMTGLHAAAGSGHSAIVKLLVEAGAEVHAKDEDGRTPLQMAQDEGHVEVIDILKAAAP